MGIAADLRKQYERAKKLGWLTPIENAASAYNFPVELILAIGSRETNLDPKYLKVSGDRGNGFSPFQVDRRSYPDWVNSGKWTNIAESAVQCCRVLAEKQAEVVREARARVVKLTTNELTRIAVAAYNRGSAGAVKDFIRDGNPDRGTTGKNYSADVLVRAKIFKRLITEDKPAEPVALPTDMPGDVTVTAVSTDPDKITAQDMQGVVTGHADSAKSIITRASLKIGSLLAIIWGSGVAGKAFLIIVAVVIMFGTAYELNKYWPKFKPWAVNIFKGLGK